MSAKIYKKLQYKIAPEWVYLRRKMLESYGVNGNLDKIRTKTRNYTVSFEPVGLRGKIIYILYILFRGKIEVEFSQIMDNLLRYIINTKNKNGKTK